MINSKFKSKSKSNDKAFTFIEILVATAVLAVGLLSVVALSSKSYAAISLQKNKLIATNLVKEEMEIIRNVRNENWLYNKDNSYCNNDTIFTICNGTSSNPDGRKAENEGDCDWRCGSKKDSAGVPIQYGASNFYILDSTDEGIKDLDYFGNVQKGSHTDTDNCKADGVGVPLFRDNTSGFYKNTNDGDDLKTPFKRLVTIKRDGDENGDGNPNNDIQVVVTVCWQERGRDAHVSTEEHLFNWMK